MYNDRNFYQGRFKSNFDQVLSKSNKGPIRASVELEQKSTTSAETAGKKNGNVDSSSNATHSTKMSKSMTNVTPAVARELQKRGYRSQSATKADK